MIRRRGSVPIAESMSAYFAICSVLFLVEATGMFRYLQKYGSLSNEVRISSILHEVGQMESGLLPVRIRKLRLL